MPEDIDINDLVDADRVEDINADEEVDASGSDLESDAGNVAGDDAEVHDEENLNDDAEDVEDDEADTDEDADEGDDEEDEGDDADARRRNPKFERRIAKEVAKRKALESQLSETSQQLKVVTDKLAELDGSGGDTFTSFEQVHEKRSKLYEEMEQIEDAIDNGGFTEKSGREIDVKTLRGWRRQVRKELDALPAVERRLERQRELNRTVVAESYPEVLDDSTDDGKAASVFLERHPSLRADPEAYLIIGDMLRGRRLRQKVSKGAKPNAARKRPPEGRQPQQATRSVRRKEPKNEDRDILDAISERLSA